MSSNALNEQIQSSVKWSAITEVVAKSIVPITNMILARILAPEAFGVITIVTMITSFADIFTDAGFQKYLIQKKFNDNEELYKNSNVAFITNLSISIFIWVVIAIFVKPIANLTGGKGYEKVIIIASSSLILTAFSSIQTAIYKKNFDFKTLFQARVIGLFIPFVITIPLALLGFNYWSLVIGTLCTNLSNALILTIKSKWKPKLYFSYEILKEMFSFSMWILIESIFLWLTTWCATFIIGKYLSEYHLGIYKNSESMVNSLLNIIVFSTSSVLLSALSTVKNNEDEYNSIFFSFQKTVSILLIPLGFGVFIFRDLATDIMLGSQWKEASLFIGLWALANVFTIVTGQYISIVFTSKGLPKLAVLSQVIQLILLVPILLISVKYGFKSLLISRSLARLLYGVINLCIAKICLKMSPIKMIKGIFPTTFASIIMSLFGIILKNLNSGILWEMLVIFLCAIIYIAIMLLIPDSRKIIINLYKKLLKKF